MNPGWAGWEWPRPGGPLNTRRLSNSGTIACTLHQIIPNLVASPLRCTVFLRLNCVIIFSCLYAKIKAWHKAHTFSSARMLCRPSPAYPNPGLKKPGGVRAAPGLGLQTHGPVRDSALTSVALGCSAQAVDNQVKALRTKLTR